MDGLKAAGDERGAHVPTRISTSQRWAAARAMVLGLCLFVAISSGNQVRAQEAASPIRQAAPPTYPEIPGRWELFAGGHQLPGEFASVTGLGVDAAGIAYIGDYANKRVQKLTPDGADAGSFPIWPGWFGPVTVIRSIVVTQDGEILILFANPMSFDGPDPYYFVRYTASGRPLGQFGLGSKDADGLSRPAGFDVAPDGAVWVADTPNHQLVVYSRDGRMLRRIGSKGTEPGQFGSPGGVGVGPDGTVYVGDTTNNRVQILSSSGAVRAIWENAGPEYDQIQSPGQIRVGRDGSVFVARGGYSGPTRFQKFSADGRLLAGAWLRPDSFAVTFEGNVLTEGDSVTTVVRRFNSNLEEYDPLVNLNVPPEAPGRLRSPNAIAFDAQDNVHISDGEQAAIFTFAPDGTFLSRQGTRGVEFGQLRSPSGVGVSADGSIYVCDYALDRIYKFSSEWQLLSGWGGAGSGPGRLLQPSDLALDAYGNVYVADQSNGRVQAFRPDGSLLMTWTSDPVQSRPTVGAGVAVDARGRVYSHGGGSTIVRMLPDGQLDGAIRLPTEGALAGITIDGSGNLWAVDAQSGRLWKYDPSGNLVAGWGSSQRNSTRSLPGPDFERPITVAVDRFGRAYVGESGSAKVWRFTPAETP